MADDLNGQILYENFKYKEHFTHLCDLKPNKDQGRFEISVVDEKQFQIPGAVYIFVVEGGIYKIGEATRVISKRIKSYNNNKGTTNVRIKEELLKINKTVAVYALFAPRAKCKLFDEEFESFVSTKAIEKKILADFEVRPVGNRTKG